MEYCFNSEDDCDKTGALPIRAGTLSTWDQPRTPDCAKAKSTPPGTHARTIPSLLENRLDPSL